MQYKLLFIKCTKQNPNISLFFREIGTIWFHLTDITYQIGADHLWSDLSGWLMWMWRLSLMTLPQCSQMLPTSIPLWILIQPRHQIEERKDRKTVLPRMFCKTHFSAQHSSEVGFLTCNTAHDLFELTHLHRAFFSIQALHHLKGQTNHIGFYFFWIAIRWNYTAALHICCQEDLVLIYLLEV